MLLSLDLVIHRISGGNRKALSRVGVLKNSIMKKSLKNLELKKQTISSLNLNKVRGGVVNSMFCLTMVSCDTNRDCELATIKNKMY